MSSELIRRFDAIVTAAPSTTAVVDGAKSLSYQQIADFSATFAGRLAEAGALPGDIVALESDRSIEWIIAMLAVLRMGGVYMPLPPDLPHERRKLLVQEAQARYVLRHPSFTSTPDDPTLVIDVHAGSTLPTKTCGASAIAEPSVTCRDRACVLFTSGTTGIPKGVVVRQSSIVRLVVDTNYIELARSDIVGFASNTAFDAVTFEVWGALLNGGRLVVIPPATLLSASALEMTIRTQGVTTLFLTTELFNRIARARPSAFRSLKTLIFGGEKANVDCVRAVLRGSGPPASLVHAYGPTECTTFSTCDRVIAVPADAKTIPIGTPISGATIHLLDERLAPVPEGEEGEICIGGDGLAEGYLGRPVDTAVAFTTISVDGNQTRIYRTGDRARRRSDGLIDYIGRRDGQIKLRGFRIETAEVEAVIASHPAVRDAVVVVYHGPGHAPRLGGCLLLNGSATDEEIDAIRDFVALRLPGPMVPARLIVYDAFPLTASKKIDRQQLQSDMQEVDCEGRSSPCNVLFRPADAVERRLARIWRGVLGHPPRHAGESFFDAGGDSLQAVEMQLRIENACGISLSPVLLIEAPTFRGIADHLRSRHSPDIRPVVWLCNAPSRPAMACVPGVFGHVFFFRNLVPMWPDDRGLCAIPSRYLRPDCDRRLLSLEEIAAENVARLEEAGLNRVEALAGYSFGGLVAYEMARLMSGRGHVPALILYDTAAEREVDRGVSLSMRMRFALARPLYRHLLRRGRPVPSMCFDPASANVAAVDTHRPGPYPGPMLLVRSTISGVARGVNPDTMGWDTLVGGPLTIEDVAVPHGDLFKPPHVAQIAAITCDYLRHQDARWR